MANEKPMSALADFLPEETYDLVVKYLHHYKVHLTVTRERSSVLGDYRNAVRGKNHRISINGNLNKYAFLITLLHELAHLLTFDQYGHKVAAHGKEWKQIYGQLLHSFVQERIFPDDITNTLRKSLQNPAASSCAEEELMRVLRNYNANKTKLLMIEELKQGDIFTTKDGRTFRREDKLRKRYRCTDIKTGAVYLFSPVYEVKLVAD